MTPRLYCAEASPGSAAMRYAVGTVAIVNAARSPEPDARLAVTARRSRRALASQIAQGPEPTTLAAHAYHLDQFASEEQFQYGLDRNIVGLGVAG